MTRLFNYAAAIRFTCKLHPLNDAHVAARRKSIDSLEAILECVQASSRRQAGHDIVDECNLSPINTSAYLRQLCQEGKLVRSGEKSAATYSLPS